MRTAQDGDRVRVHYVKRYQDGSSAASPDGAPLEVTVGVDHPRLPGLGRALVGLAPGALATVMVPPGCAHPAPDPRRVRRWPRNRFLPGQPLRAGGWVRVTDRRGRRRLVRVVELSGRIVVVDTNHPRAGQGVKLEVRLIDICAPNGSTFPGPWREVLPLPRAEGTMTTQNARAVVFDADADSLATLRAAFPEWEVEAIDGTTARSLARDWNPGAAELLVVGARGREETLGLCRALRSQAGRAQTPLLVLVGPAEEAFVEAALAAGVHGCLILPVHPKDFVTALARAQGGNVPGRHTLGLQRAQSADSWRDDGGEG